MPFPQQQVEWMLANREKIFRYYFIPQALAAFLFLTFSYATGKVHAHLLLHGVRTNGTIVSLKPVQMQTRSRDGSSGLSETIYEPAVEFRAGERLVRFQEWKGQASNAGLGWSVPVIYDPADPSFAMIDRSYWNWLPWAPCFAIGLILALASIKGLFLFLFQRSPEPAPGIETRSA
ncbi:MAG TPA: DUF3592 domain-containing protein [Candidatus Acidoferrum sp.]|nr:DUF3592 domain-containing protein [Candidatus Acidoferrum sp.]